MCDNFRKHFVNQVVEKIEDKRYVLLSFAYRKYGGLKNAIIEATFTCSRKELPRQLALDMSKNPDLDIIYRIIEDLSPKYQNLFPKRNLNYPCPNILDEIKEKMEKFGEDMFNELDKQKDILIYFKKLEFERFCFTLFEDVSGVCDHLEEIKFLDSRWIE